MQSLDLASLTPQEHWPIYERVMRLAAERDIPFALGGALAMGAYSDRWRPTKDLDLYIVPEDRERMVQTFCDAGLVDYFDQVGYDRRWIYRGYQDGCIVDAIWAMANQRTIVDRKWLERGRQFDSDGLLIRVLPPEELIWSKLYVMQRDRCDWPDILNILYATSDTLDWHHLLSRMGSDLPLLRGVLSIFFWMCPSCAENLPETVRLQLDLNTRDTECPLDDAHRVNLLDTRPWFGPMQKAAA